MALEHQSVTNKKEKITTCHAYDATDRGWDENISTVLFPYSLGVKKCYLKEGKKHGH
jgi:hypothetical protein